MLNEGDILIVNDVARLLRISRAAVYKLRVEGVLPAKFKLFDGERGWRWVREDVETFLASRAVVLPGDRTPKPFIPVSLALHKSSSLN